MSLFLTGDTHGFTAPIGHTSALDRFSDANLERCGIDPAGLSPEDVFLVAGDLGWCYDGGERDERLLDFLQGRCEELGGAVLCGIDGNHDNFLAYEEYPLVEFCRGRAHQLRENVFHVPRGEVLTIDDKTVFCLGGAQSIDKEWRIPGKSWWPEEEISWSQEMHAKANLDAVGWTVDVVVTHTAPVSMIKAAGVTYMKDTVAEILQTQFYPRLKYGLWAFGHFHEVPNPDRLRECYDAIILFDDIIRMD